MPAVSERQRRAACADLGRKQKGQGARTFPGMSIQSLSDFCKKPLAAKKGGRIHMRRKRGY